MITTARSNPCPQFRNSHYALLVKNLQEVMASALHGEGEREDGGELATRQVLFARFALISFSLSQYRCRLSVRARGSTLIFAEMIVATFSNCQKSTTQESAAKFSFPSQERASCPTCSTNLPIATKATANLFQNQRSTPTDTRRSAAFRS
jgi:hypothetical protein